MLSCSSCVQLFATPWTVAYQAPLSMGFSRQECWSGLPCPPPGGLPNPGMEPEPVSLMSPALAGRFFTTRKQTMVTREKGEIGRLGLTYTHCGSVLVAQSCLTLCNRVDYSLPGSSVHGILQARILEWVAMPSSRGSSQPRDRIWVSSIAGRFFTI